jgi:hypothetical protein
MPATPAGLAATANIDEGPLFITSVKPLYLQFSIPSPFLNKA